MARFLELLRRTFSRKAADRNNIMNLTLRQLKEQNIHVKIENDRQLDMTYGEYLKILKSKPVVPSKKQEYKTSFIVIDNEIIGSDDVQKIIEPLWWSVSIYTGEAQYEKDLNRFSIAQRYVFAIERYVTEVNNGGHAQFYFNSAGIVWEDAMTGFEIIKAQKNYEIIRESISRMGGKPSKDREKRQAQIEKYKPDFEDLDAMYYECESDMAVFLYAYIQNNAKEFLFSGEVQIPI